MLARSILGPAMEVIREPDPLPPDMAYALSPVVLLVLLVMLYIAVRHRRHRVGPHGERRAGWMASLALGVALGNALAEINVSLEPNRPVVAMMVTAQPDYTADGDPP